MEVRLSALGLCEFDAVRRLVYLQDSESDTGLLGVTVLALRDDVELHLVVLWVNLMLNMIVLKLCHHSLFDHIRATTSEELGALGEDLDILSQLF